jgi:hypothetical protein
MKHAVMFEHRKGCTKIDFVQHSSYDFPQIQMGDQQTNTI